MQKIKTQVAIIGAGTAGLNAYKSAKEESAHAIIIDRGPLGTTSIKTGAVPTQLLRELSITKQKQTPTTFSLYSRPPETKLNNDQILEVVRQRKLTFFEDFIKEIYTIPEDERYVGQASFKDCNTLELAQLDLEITAQSFVIATGSEPYVPYGLKRLGARVLTTNEFFDLPVLPKSIAIFGSGSIGLELGQSLTRLGIKTIIFGLTKLWHLTDQKVANEALSALRERAYIIMDSRITDMEAENDNIKIYYLDENNHECFLNVEYVLCATGRRPKLDNLNLHVTGIIHDSEGMPYVNPLTMQTNVPHIFLAGDVSTNNGCLQNAINQGKIAGKNAARFPQEALAQNIPRQEIVFTDPQMALVGLTYNEVNEQARQGQRYILGEASMRNNTRAKIKEHKYGLVHVFFAESDARFIGAEICAPDAEYIAQFLNCALSNHMTLKDLLAFSFYHPSIFEVMHEAFIDAEKKFALQKNHHI